jgi:hypothetical protein
MSIGTPADCLVSEQDGRRKRALKIRAVCPRCGVDAPLLENQCRQCQHSLMTRCHRCGGVAHLAEPRCEFCHIEHPALGNPASHDLDGPAPVPAPPTVGPDGQPLAPPLLGPDGQPLAPAGVPFAALPGGGVAGSPMPQYVPGITTGPPPAPLPGAARAARRGRRSAGATTVVVVLGVLAKFGVAYVAAERREADRASAASSITIPAGETVDTVSTPAYWESSIQPLAEFVEDERGALFDHPVAVEFLDGEAFTQAFRGDPSVRIHLDTNPAGTTPTTEPAATPPVLDSEQTVEVFRALGLVSGELDLSGSTSAVVDDSILGFYDHHSKRLVVRGSETDLSPAVRLTVVHELTHAWDDQKIGLSGFEDEPDEPATARRALIEGNAKRVERAYRETFTDAEYQQYREELWGPDPVTGVVGSEVTDNPYPGPPIPDIVLGSLDFPYVFGEGFVSALFTKNGNDAIDAAYAAPPVNEEQVMFPATYLTGQAAAVVPVPSAPDGQTVVSSGTLGTFDLLLVLGSRLGFDRGWGAVQGWGGDSYLVADRAGTTCVRVVAVGDTPEDTEQLGSAFADWAASVPGATGGLDERGAFLDNCDAGGVAPVELPEATSTLTLAEVRAYFVDEMQRILNSTRPAAECVVDGIRSELGNDGFYDLWTSTEDDGAFRDPYVASVRACSTYFPELAAFVR